MFETLDGDVTFVLGRQNAVGEGFGPFSSVNLLRDCSSGGPENAYEFTQAIDEPGIAHGLVVRGTARLLTLTGPRFDGMRRFPAFATPMFSILGDINYV